MSEMVVFGTERSWRCASHCLTMSFIVRKDASLTIRMTAALKDALARAAEADERSIAQLAVKVLSEHLRSEGWLTDEPAEAKGARPRRAGRSRKGKR